MHCFSAVAELLAYKVALQLNTLFIHILPDAYK